MIFKRLVISPRSGGGFRSSGLEFRLSGLEFRLSGSNSASQGLNSASQGRIPPLRARIPPLRVEFRSSGVGFRSTGVFCDSRALCVFFVFFSSILRFGVVCRVYLGFWLFCVFPVAFLFFCQFFCGVFGLPWCFNIFSLAWSIFPVSSFCLRSCVFVTILCALGAFNTSPAPITPSSVSPGPGRVQSGRASQGLRRRHMVARAAIGRQQHVEGVYRNRAFAAGP